MSYLLAEMVVGPEAAKVVNLAWRLQVTWKCFIYAMMDPTVHQKKRYFLHLEDWAWFI